MEKISQYYHMGILGLSESSFVTLMLALIGGGGIGGLMKLKNNRDSTPAKTEKKDNNQVLFDQVNDFIEQQKLDRDDLRKEIKDLREELEMVRQSDLQKEIRINTLVRELAKEKQNNADLRAQVDELRADAIAVAASKVIEDKEK